jgi:enoyl-[acyl-carrier protein] reductase II
MLAAMSLGADGVQIGSRFAVCKESSAHENFKNYVFDAKEGQTDLTLKEITAVRLLKNDFYNKVQEAYLKNATDDELKELLGRGRAKKGMFEGDLSEGELEIGQVSSMINKMQTSKEIINEIIDDFNNARNHLSALNV